MLYQLSPIQDSITVRLFLGDKAKLCGVHGEFS